MTPGYAEALRATAKAIGLGNRRKPGTDEQGSAATLEPTDEPSDVATGDAGEPSPKRSRLGIRIAD